MNLNTVEFLLQEAWISVKRNGVISAAAVINVAAVLVLAGVMVLTVVNVDHLVGKQAAQATITVDLKPDAQPADVEAALLANEKVKRTRFVPKDENLRELARAMNWPLESLAYLDNPLPDCIRVETVRPEDVPEVAEAAKKIKGVAAVHYAKEVTMPLLKLFRALRRAGAALVGLMALASLLIITTTIRLTIYARRREIRIMQLVGATHWFIRLPFLLEGSLYGFVGGILAATVVLAGYAWVEEQVSRSLPFIDLVFGPRQLALVAAIIVVTGIAFGFLGSLIATKEYLRET